MKTVKESVDIVVVGGGTAGHIAALQAARTGVRTSVIEAGSMLAGTMTAGGVNMPNHFFSTNGPVVLGIPWELFSKSKQIEGLPIPDYTRRRPVESPGYYSYINIPIYVAVVEEEAAKAGLIIHYHEFVSDIKAIGDTWEITSMGRGIKRFTTAKEVIDASGDSDVARLLGLEVMRDEVRQPGSYQYRIGGIQHDQIWEKEVQIIYEEALEKGEIQKGDFAYPNMLPFKYYLDHGGHNCTHIYDSDTSDADGQTFANLEGRQRMLRMYKFLTSSIPGCERAVLDTMYPRAVSRETFRIKGEYIVTKEDFMQATDFEDKICNAFNYIDMHSQKDGCDVVFHESKDLLPKVPYRALIPRNSARITAAGRIISAHRVALAGIRAQCVCMAMGQAMGAAASLAVQKNVPSREINSKDILALTIEHGALPI
jgi:hypothetical protein